MPWSSLMRRSRRWVLLSVLRMNHSAPAMAYARLLRVATVTEAA